MSEFRPILTDILSQTGIKVSGKVIDDLCIYNKLLIEWNERMNLTALIEPRDVALKHFADCLSLLGVADIPQGASVIDVGTGAGFPGLVLRVARPDIRLTLLDSLNKRLVFLSEVCGALGIGDVTLIHSRAEDSARGELRDSFDIAVARAVAPMNILAEYTLPYVRVGGRLIAMKGRDAPAELRAAEGAIAALSGSTEAVHTFELLDAGERSVICIAKTSPTDPRYPRLGKKIKTKPLV